MVFLTCNVVKCLLLLLVLCMFEAELTSGCDNFGRGCYNHGPAESAQLLNRKVTAGAYVLGSRKKLEEIFKDNTGREHGKSPVNNVYGGIMVDSELRNVPSGPDPLHHHGGTPNPKNPHTP